MDFKELKHHYNNLIKFLFILLKLNYFNWKRKRGISMNTLVIVLIAAVLLSCAYVFYGRWLANKWGINPKAETPAKKFEDGKDYVPTDGWTVFSHQFSSIAGAGPVTGAIQAAVFGWVPVLLWVLIGGIFNTRI